jgi:hypothetical protein
MWPAYEKLALLTKYRKCPNYQPAVGDQLPSYFYSMLDDVDRTMQYSKAIQECLAHVPVNNPWVIDVGVGTGLLSGLVLFHDPNAIVVGVDVNEAALDSARQVMNDLGFSNRFYGVRVNANMSSTSLLKTIQSKINSKEVMPFDMIVSEILGTLVYGESMDSYVSKYIPLVKTFNDRLYAVPQKCTQFFACYEFEVPLSSKYAIEHALDDALMFKEYVPSDKGGLGIAFHLYEHKLTNSPLPIYESMYDRKPTKENPTIKTSRQIFNVTTSSNLHLGVFEWECDLWNGTMLKNTIEQYKYIAETTGERYAFARQNAWGFMVCNLQNIETVHVRYTKQNCTEISMLSGSNTFMLDDVASDRFPWVSTSADIALARELSDLIKSRVKDDVSTVIHVIDDVTCGMFTHNLSEAFNHAKIDVSAKFYPGTQDLVKEVCKNTRVSVLNVRGIQRRLNEISQPTCIVCPSLCYMHLDYENKKQLYTEFARSLGCNLVVPDVNALRENLQRTTTSGPMIQHEQFPNNATAIAQMIKHKDIRFSTRDFHSVPFWKLDNSTQYEVDMNVKHIVGNGPVANLSHIENLLETHNYASALARMLGGSGIICRAGHMDDVDSSSEEEDDDDDDDDDDEYKQPAAKRPK